MTTTSLKYRNAAFQGLVLVGLGGALLSSSILAVATFLLGIAGMVVIKRGSLYAAGWDTPRELRLLHFAFWFFVAVSIVAWAVSGFSYEGFKALGTPFRLILFWPLAVALTYASLRAHDFFSAAALAALSAGLAIVIDLIFSGADIGSVLHSRAGWDLNAITFGNLALLSGMLSLIGGLFFFEQRRTLLALVLVAASLTALTAAFLSQTRSSFLAFPVLLLLVLPLLRPRMRIPALLAALILFIALVFASERAGETVQSLLDGELDRSVELRLIAWNLAWEIFLSNPLLGAGLDGYELEAIDAATRGDIAKDILNCCTGHAHNDLLHLMATRGTLGILSWLFLIGIPLWTFSRYIFNRQAPVSYIAVAGTMVPVAYMIFGLTEATLSRSLFLTFYLLLVAALACALFTELSLSYTRRRSVRVTATVITMNEAENIADCLRSARLVADEIVVLDSGSTDRTVEIARQYADVVEVTDWPGFGIQKQRALDRASGDWVLSIDADERISDQLAREINDQLAAPDADAYKLPWAVTLYGKRLDFGRSGRAPLRLFRREGVRFSDALVHEKILIPEGRRIRTLRGRLIHYTHRDFGHALEKGAKYAWLGSLEKYRKNKRSRWLLYAAFRGYLTFFHVYIIRFGFLDGPVGYLVAVIYAQVTFNKYAGLWTLGRTERR